MIKLKYKICKVNLNKIFISYFYYNKFLMDLKNIITIQLNYKLMKIINNLIF